MSCQKDYSSAWVPNGFCPTLSHVPHQLPEHGWLLVLVAVLGNSLLPSSMVSQPLADAWPSFASYRITDRSHAASNDGSSDKSPTSTPKLEVPVAHRLRPPLVSRSTHDASVRERVKVHTVLEPTRTPPHTPNVGAQYWAAPATSYSAGEPPSRGNSRSRVSTPTSPQPEISDSVRTSKESRRILANVNTPRAGTPSWVRSSSSGLFFRMHKHSRSGHNSGSRPNTSSRHTSAGEAASLVTSMPTKTSDTPLNLKARASESTIIVEEAFRHPSSSSSSAHASSVDSMRKATKPSSVTAKRLLSAPVYALRKLVSGDDNLRRTMLCAENTKHHQDSKKRDKTGHVLEKVSQALLRLTEAPAEQQTVASVSAVRSTTQISRVLAEPSRTDMRLPTKPQSSTHLERILSGLDLSTLSSVSTSSRRLSTMPVPTPEERATYKVKRSATADTETFIKTDISVRGKTSYLPSEARRIHTPPLPDDRRSRRGHFFDYNLHNHHVREHLHSPQQLSVNETLNKCSSHLAPVTKSGGRSRSNTGRSDNSRSGTETAWYDVQLANIDKSDCAVILSRQNSDKSVLSRLSTMSLCRSGCMANVAELERQQYEARLDYEIPEHLPTSPLCPRNPRYWRVVRNKGSQFRGC